MCGWVGRERLISAGVQHARLWKNPFSSRSLCWGKIPNNAKLGYINFRPREPICPFKPTCIVSRLLTLPDDDGPFHAHQEHYIHAERGSADHQGHHIHDANGVHDTHHAHDGDNGIPAMCHAGREHHIHDDPCVYATCLVLEEHHIHDDAHHVPAHHHHVHEEHHIHYNVPHVHEEHHIHHVDTHRHPAYEEHHIHDNTHHVHEQHHSHDAIHHPYLARKDNLKQERHRLQQLCDLGHLNAAVSMLLQMSAPLPPNAYLSLLKTCCRRKALLHVKQVQAHLTQHKLVLSSLLRDYLVVALSKCGAVDDARHALHALPQRTVFSWTAVISATVECGRYDEAFTMYHEMLMDGVRPNSYTFTGLFKACGSKGDVEQGVKLHADARQYGVTSNAFVANTLVHMYGKCGAIVEAWDVFHMLSHRDVVAWNTMLSACVENGQSKTALHLYRQMQEEGQDPSNLTFVAVLQACGAWAEEEKGTCSEARILSLKIGQYLHGDARQRGIDCDIFVGNTLVSMYRKCGALVDAENVFSALSQQTVVSWNAMLSAYIEHRKGEEALQFYKHMHERHEAPNQLTFVIALQACAILAEKEGATVEEGQTLKAVSLEIGQAIHVDASRHGFTSNVHVCNALVNLYGKCGSVSLAEEVFGGLAYPSSVSFNAMLSAYVENCEGEKALELYRCVYKTDASPDRHMLAIALQACAIVVEKEEATVVECQLIKKSSLEILRALQVDARAFASKPLLDTSLLSLYGKCGNIVDAEILFASSPSRDVVLWTAMLSAYVDQGQGDKALQLYRQMLDESWSPNHLTYVMALKACIHLAEDEEEGSFFEGNLFTSLNIGQALHADARREGLASHTFVSNTLVCMYGKLGTIEEAENVFSMLFRRDIVSWTVMLTAYVEQGYVDKALQLYVHMQREGVSPNQLTIVRALQACCVLAEKEVTEGRSVKQIALKIGQALHSDAYRENLLVESFVGNALVTMYGKCGGISEAEEVFNTLLSRQEASWTVMLCAYLYQNQADKALQLYAQMQVVGVALDDISLTCMLQACGETGRLETIKQLHFMAVCMCYDVNLILVTTLIHEYGSCGSTLDGHAVFDAIFCRHLCSWNACIAGYVKQGDWVTSLHIFQRLYLESLVADEITFTLVLAVCSHAGLVGEGFKLFGMMNRHNSITPSSKNFASFIDLFGRVGDFKRVENILERLPMQVDLSIWLCILGVCRIHGNTELAQHAFDHALRLEHKEAAVYVLMSNMTRW